MKRQAACAVAAFAPLESGLRLLRPRAHGRELRGDLVRVRVRLRLRVRVRVRVRGRVRVRFRARVRVRVRDGPRVMG